MEKDKYFLVIAVDQTGLTGTDLDLPRVNGARVAETFSRLGYKPLLEQSPFLSGDQTHRGNVISALELLTDLGHPTTVVVYYSGHGITSKQEQHLWLQLYGQDTIGPGHGIPLIEMVKIPRMAGFHGELFVILDASYSGRSPLSDALEFKDLDENTLIFSSSSITQNSQTLRLADGNKSAFTHNLLKALTSQWSIADENRDGILRYSELDNFTRVQLHRHFQNKDIPELMTPRLIGPKHEEFLIAYQRDQVQHWGTRDRQTLQVLALERTLSPTVNREKLLATKSSQKLGASQQAQALAKHINPNTNSRYAQGLVALAEGKLDEARKHLAQAETQAKFQEHHLAKIYLARGRTEIYAGRFGLAVPWYKKTLALQPPEEPKLLNEFGLVWVKAGLHEEALQFFEQGLKLREKRLDPM
ncbi:MAG: tetratricopeptide repeat protein, partial [Nitrospirales bacterium]|nr:tetratricopeptide repeat protein [Nitrospirales bacterium]